MRLSTALLFAAGSALTLAPSTASAQSVIYSQNFNLLGGGFVGDADFAGWNVYTGATSTSLGTAQTATNVTTTAGSTTAWADSGGKFKNFAAASTGSTAVTATQTAATDRALGVRTTGSFGDPGAAFAYTWDNSTYSISSISIDLQMLNVQGRSQDWRVQIATGAAPTSWTTLETVSDTGVFGSTTKTYSLGSFASLSILDGSANAWFRVVSLTTATGSNNRDSFAIDNFSISGLAIPTGNYWAPGASGGGAGTWSSDSRVWSATLGTQGTGIKAASGALLFGGTAGTVTVSGTVTTNAGLTFSTDGYTLTGGTVTLGGADAAANTLTVNSAVGTTINSALSAANGLTKAGNGTLTLGGSNTLGAVTVSAGGLVLANASALGSTASGTTVSSGATLNLNGQTIGAEAIALSGTLANSSGTAASLSGLVTASGSAGISTTGNLTLSGGTAGTGSITKSGNGTLTLTGSTGHSGGTTVSAGTLATSGSGTLTGNVTLASGATLTLAGATTLGTLSAANSTLNLTFGSALTTSALNLDGTLNLSLLSLGATPVPGTYNLLTFSTLTGSGSINFTPSLIGYGLVGTLGADSYSLTISLLAQSLSWGGGNATWSVGGGNWTNDTTTSADTFENGDQVTFGSGISGGTVTVSEGVTFGSFTVNTENINLTFAGAGLAGAGNVVLNGAGTTVTLNNANTFTGAVQVNAGKLIAANNAALGTTGGSTTVAAGAELSLEGGITVTNEALSLAGTLSSGAGNNTFTGAITLTNNATLSAAADSGLTVSGAITGVTRALSVAGDGTTTLSGGVTAASLTKSDAGTLTISAASTLTSGATLNAGTLNLNHATALGNATLTINGGALGNTSGSAKTVANALTVGGNFALGTATSNGELTLSGAANLGAASRTVSVTGSHTLSGAITNGSLVKAGEGTLTLSGTNTLDGLSVNTGTLRMGSAGALGGSAVTVESGASLELNGQNATLTSLVGSGTVANGGSTNSTLTLNTASATTVATAFADGAGSGKLGLTKSGNGALTLTASSTNTGAVAINAGSVLANAADALGTGTVSLARGTSLFAGNETTQTNNITVSSGITGGFIISEHVEGNSNNKYIELYNGTGVTLNLSEYQIANYSNGAVTPSTPVNLGTFQSTLEAGQVIVLRNSGAALTLPAGVTTYASAVTNINGDDAFALQRIDGTNIDIFGVLGSDPGTAWTAANGNTTNNATIVRKADVLTGVSVNPPNTTAVTGFLTLGTEWTQSAIDTVSNLGSHTMNVPPPGPAPVIGVTDSDSTASFGGNISLLGSADLTAAADSLAIFSGDISGVGALTKVGEGRVVLSGANTFSGGITVSAGTLEAASTGALGAGTVTVSGGTLDLGGLAVAGTIAVSGGTLAGAGSLDNTATLQVGADSTLTFATVDAYGLANILLSGGTLDLNNLNPDNVITFVSGTFLNASAWNGTVAPTGTGDVTAQLAALGAISGNIQLQAGQSANLAGLDLNIVFNGATVSGLDTFTGNLTVAGGTLNLTSGQNLGGTVTLSTGGTINFGSAESSQAITYAGGTITGSSYFGAVTIADGANVTVSSSTFGSFASLRTAANSTLTLSGNVSNAITFDGGSITGLANYTGTLTIAAGVNLNENGTIGGSVALQDGSTLSGNVVIVGNLSQTSGSAVAPGNSPGTLEVQGTFAPQGGAIFEMEIQSLLAPDLIAAAGTNYDTILVTGLLDLSGINSFTPYIIRLVSINGASENVTAEGLIDDQGFTLQLFSFTTLELGGQTLSDLFQIQTDALGKSFFAQNGVTALSADRFSLSIGDNNNILLTYSAIPEPSTYGLILGGLALAGAAIRRRKNKTAVVAEAKAQG